MADQPDIWYLRRHFCLLDGADFVAHRMYPTHQRAFEQLDTYFDIPYFSSPPDGTFANLTMQEIQVCPSCGFASNCENYFDSPSKYLKAITLREEDKTALLADRDARLEVFERTVSLYECPRSLDDALLSHRLAIMTCETLYEVDTERFVNELLRAPNYALKAGRLCLEAGRAGAHVEWLFEALALLNKTIESEVTGLTRYRVLYQLLALSIALGEDKTSSMAYTQLMRLSREDSSSDIIRYMNRAKEIWQDRKECQEQYQPEMLR